MKKETVQRVFVRLYQRDGQLTPSAIVKEAKKKSSTLHALFEWDDTAAAREYRLGQARNLIRRIRVIEIDGKEETLINVPVLTHEEGAYLTGTALVKSMSDLELAMEQAMKKLAAAQRAVDEIKGVVDEADEERLTMLLVAAEAMTTARTALEKIH